MEDALSNPISPAARLSRRAVGASALACGAFGWRPARAAAPLTMVVPFEAGSAPDLYARLIAPGMGERLQRTIVVESHPGAAGNVGAQLVAREPPDAAPIIVGTAALCEINPLVFDNLRWSMKDFTPLVKGVQSPLVLVTHPGVPAKTLDEVVAWGKANSGKLSYASYSAGAPGDFLSAKFNQTFGLDLAAAPYRGSASQVAALIAGQAPIGFAQTQNAAEYVRTGALNAIAVTSDARFRLMPQTPTFAELGHDEFTTNVWFGLLTRAGVAPDIVSRMIASAGQARDEPQARSALLAQGYDLPNQTGEAFARSIAAGAERWAGIVKAANFKVRP